MSTISSLNIFRTIILNYLSGNLWISISLGSLKVYCVLLVVSCFLDFHDSCSLEFVHVKSSHFFQTVLTDLDEERPSSMGRGMPENAVILDLVVQGAKCMWQLWAQECISHWFRPHGSTTSTTM